MPKYTLKNGKTLEFKNNRWYYNGKPTNKTHIILDTDGYYKQVMPDGTLAVKDYDENGKPNKITYIGGTTKESRDKYWQQAPIARHAVDSIANSYGINPGILRTRLDVEGYTDRAIKFNNNYALSYNKDKHIADDGLNLRKSSNYEGLLTADYNDGFNYFGLDDIASLIDEGKVQPINEEWYPIENENEKGRIILSTNGYSNLDNIGLTAATLKYLRNEVAKDFPKANRTFLDEAAGIYYNRGVAGGRSYLKSR